MKRCVLKGLVVITLLLPALLFSQEITSNKFALVIGNGAYNGLTRLNNPVNDANDVAASLESLGFTVDKILNGSQEQIDNAVIQLKNRLSVSGNAYGFFFYAGHGVQSAGENYLIPVNANIPTENALRSRAVSVQMILDELNDARNSLNVVVLDACRDNPFSWSRSGNRGLTIISRQPADSIIVYATSAGARASDGEGRNGLFTSKLLNNLTTPGLEVTEVFRRTGLEVADASQNQQIPAIYSQFFKTAYLGSDPSGQGFQPGTAVARPLPSPPPRTEREKKERPGNVSARLWTAGASLGTSFVEPWVVATVRGTVAPFDYFFLEPGMDIGFVSGASDVGYYSFCPFVHAAFFWPFSDKIGAYAGAGGSFMFAKYSFPNGDLSKNVFGVDVAAGVNLFGMVDVSFTFRTNFSSILNKLSVGYTYRF